MSIERSRNDSSREDTFCQEGKEEPVSVDPWMPPFAQQKYRGTSAGMMRAGALRYERSKETAHRFASQTASFRSERAFEKAMHEGITLL